MLGRQQIAGIPTAIHELLKNAHDAYAERADLDLFRKDRLLIIRDNGYGMTREDFEGRWLTLGTESKIGSDKPDSDFAFPDRPKEPTVRSVMGEKGIGRLAISTIGPQTLVMTRATRRDGLHSLVACLIHWGLFEIPGLDLDRIQVPVEELPVGKLPDRAFVRKLSNQVRSNVLSLDQHIPETYKEGMLSDLDLMDFDPAEIEKRLGGLTLSGNGYGTHFFIRPTNPLLIDDIEGGTEGKASPLEKMLLGFSNTMMPAETKPTIVAEFRDHREDGTIEELVGVNSFFTPEEFKSADHHIEGRFDEYGQFSGTVSLYDLPSTEYNVYWPDAAGQKTECGPFRIKFAYVHGDWKDSRLPQDDWVALNGKLTKIGGLYVYRDGIRILPYGNSDYDFLNIERRRTLKAADWFFSYRQIIGAVAISGSENKQLVEKAGREGFRENRAYRQFVSILENLFIRLAKDFFRKESQQFGDAFYEVQKQINRERALLKKREVSTRVRRKQFLARLNGFFDDLERGTQAAEAERIRNSVSARLAEIVKSENGEDAAKALLDLEDETRNAIEKLSQANTIIRPRSVGLTRSAQSDWSAYTQNAEKVRSEVLVPLAQDVDAMITAVASEHTIALKRQRRLTAAIDSKRNLEAGLVSRAKREVEKALKDLTAATEDAMTACISALAAVIEKTLIEVQSTDFTGMTDSAARNKHVGWEQRLDTTAVEARNTLESLKDQLEAVAKGIREREMLDETTAAIESAAEGYREQLDLYIELAQVGMALGIVQHEFGAAVRNIRSAIRKLKPWADGTPDLRDIYKGLRVEFDHLDEYLTLFTPMSRRLNRQAVDLSGEEIRRYVSDVFHDRLERHSITLTATRSFDGMTVHGYPSTFLPAFVNVVDNAIYWITSDKRKERVIRLDARNGAFEISNSGPGIERRLADQIFDYGMTTKVGGRGLGLYISREALRRGGYDMTVETGGIDSSPVFRIAPIEGLVKSEVEE
jgi:signal transduction histidine kinase